jgi:hypothetical protein
MLKKNLILSIGFFLSVTAVQAEVSSWKDASGNIIYSDQKPSAEAKPQGKSSAINSYHHADTIKQKNPITKITPSESLSVITAEEVPQEEAEPVLTEQYCQSNYNRSCDEVSNWESYAKEQCGSDPRCEDPDFLDRKYRPRSNEEIKEIALRAAIRNNNQDQKIAMFLRKKYTNYCQNQAEMLCRNKISRNCQATMKAYCDDPRDINDIFNRYDNLSAAEKRAVIAKAKKLALASGDQQLDYDQLLVSLIEILVSQATLGI